VQFSAIENQNVHFYSPRYVIRISGKDILRQGAEVVSLSVNEVLDGATSLSFTVLNSGLKWLNSPLFTAGTEVEVAAGYKEPLEVIFNGEISQLRPTFPANGDSQMEVSGHDFSHKLSRGCRFRSWDNVTDSNIATKIAGEHGLDPSGVKATTVTHPKIKQDGESDLEFLKKRAAKNNFEVAVRGKQLIFAEPQDQSSAPEVTTLKWGESLISFSPELNTAGQVSEVTVRGWNPTAKKEIVGKASWKDIWGNQPGRQSGGELVEKLYGKVEECIRGEPVYTPEEANTRARSVLKERSEQFISGSGESIGIPQIRVRTSLILEGVGAFSMKYYVTGATHSISSSGYKTNFTVRGDTYARAG
jgi:phage protein D